MKLYTFLRNGNSWIFKGFGVTVIYKPCLDYHMLSIKAFGKVYNRTWIPDYDQRYQDCIPHRLSQDHSHDILAYVVKGCQYY